MNIRDLYYIIAVADVKHFGKAAERCCVSQPTLSGQIKKLEDTLGVTLFSRTNRTVQVTDAGQEIIATAKRAIAEVDSIYEIAQRAKNPLGGTFRLGAFPTIATYLLPKLVPRVNVTMPDLRLILVEEKTEALIHKLKQRELDAAFIALPVQESCLMSHKLFDDPFFLAVPKGHPLAAHKRVNHTMLQEHRVLLLEEGHCLRDQALEVCQLHNIAEAQDFKATSLETLRQMVKAGTGITFIPKIALTEDAGLHYIPFDAPAPKRTIGLVWRKECSRMEVIEGVMGVV